MPRSPKGPFDQPCSDHGSNIPATLSTGCSNTCNFEKYLSGSGKVIGPYLRDMELRARGGPSTWDLSLQVLVTGSRSSGRHSRGWTGLGPIQWAQSGAKGDRARNRNGDKTKDTSMIQGQRQYWRWVPMITRGMYPWKSCLLYGLDVHERASGKTAKVEQQYRNIQTLRGQARLKQLLFKSVSSPTVQMMDPRKVGQGHWALLSVHSWVVSVSLGTRQPSLLLCWIKKIVLNKWNYHLLKKLMFYRKLILNSWNLEPEIRAVFGITAQ